MALSSINSSLISQQRLSASQASFGNSISRLSSGIRISSAQNDAAGPSLADRVQAQTDRLSQSQKNNNQAIAEVQTRDGELNEVSRLLNRMLELRSQSDSGNLHAQDREAVEKAFEESNDEINRIADAYNPLAYRPDYTAALGTRDGSLQSTDDIRKAMETVTGMRWDLGAQQNALSQSFSDLQQPSTVDPSAIRPRILDAGDASETSVSTRAQLLQQAGAAMLSQANALPQQVLALLR